MSSMLLQLPSPPHDKTGWPWTMESEPLPLKMPNGEPWPRISIVTPSYNQGDFIEETIRSVLLQNYPNLEYIIMDGGSKDNSIDIIKKYESFLTHWESKTDKGQADAINKALSISSGIWFHNINSDDLLTPNALKMIGLCEKEYDLIASPVLNFGPKETVTENKNLKVDNLLKLVWNNENCSWHQPGLIMKRENLIKIGGYPNEFYYVFDFIALCKYIEKYNHLKILSHVLTKFRVHGQSKTGVWGDKQENELFKARLHLSSSLQTPKLRRLAKREAHRRRLRNTLQNWFTQKISFKMALFILRQVLMEPYLMFDRNLFFFIRVKLTISKY